VRQVWIALGLLATAIFAGWSLLAYRAASAAHDAIVSDDAVAVRHEEGIWSFTSRRPSPAAAQGFIFFPGALVDPIAYAPLTRAVAEAGFPAYIVELPRRGAFGGAEDPRLRARFDALVRQRDTPRRWVLAGHSRGGVVASAIASQRPAGLAGLVLIGTSHPRDVDLSGLSVPVTKIAGTRDGLASPAKVEANRRLLPPSTRWIWIEGGNHSQFGWYGFQPGDRWAGIDAGAQRTRTIEAVVAALQEAAASAPSGPRRRSGR
jgi:pimeloyl-ACP methyl ester carboxylesterase